jgi:seryl-tRNA synthetase
MFNKNIENSIELAKKDLSLSYEQKISKLEKEQELALLELETTHRLALSEKDFQIKHYESETIKSLNEKINNLEKDKAVLQKEKEMLDKITDLNADVIDVKELVKNLINKLPEVKINSLSVQSNQKDKE